MASELSLFSSTSNAGEGICAAAKFAPSSKTPNTAAPQIEVRPEFIRRLIISPLPRTRLCSKYYTLVAQPFLLVFFLLQTRVLRLAAPSWLTNFAWHCHPLRKTQLCHTTASL